MTRIPGDTVAAVLREACYLDVRALKPGNVSVYSPGHRMTAADFVRSADAAVPLLVRDGLTVGQRIRAGVEATFSAVGCNTNLGILLLLAPLVHAALADCCGGMRQRLAAVLADLSVEDARDAYAAIRIADPAGLGVAPSQQIDAEPTVSLRDAMAISAAVDRIAHQYTTDFEDIFTVGVPALQQCAGGWGAEWASVSTYLMLATIYCDSHLIRKYGLARAEAVRQALGPVESLLKACDNPFTAVPMLLEVDEKLKQEGTNPGTSADLTVASLVAWRLQALLDNN